MSQITVGSKPVIIETAFHCQFLPAPLALEKNKFPMKCALATNLVSEKPKVTFSRRQSFSLSLIYF